MISNSEENIANDISEQKTVSQEDDSEYVGEHVLVEDNEKLLKTLNTPESNNKDIE